MTPGSVLVYVVICKPNGKLYFGVTTKSIRDRAQRHLQSARQPRFIFHRAIRKYGPHNFIWCELGSVSTREEAFRVERSLIRKYRTKNPLRGYNATDGGEGPLGRKPSEATLVKLRARRHSEATKERMRAAHLGNVPWNKGISLPEEMCRNRLGNQNRLGKKHSEETRAKLKGRRVSEETRAKISAKLRGNQNAKRPD